MKRRKDYIVTIISKNYKQEVQVRAENKEDAENIVDNVLLGCDYFVFNSKDEYKLKIRKKRWREK
jgi:hypothetical protein